MFEQVADPVGGSLALSALVAAIPLLTLFVLLGALKVKAWLAGLISLAVALVLAVVAFRMPVGQAALSATEGAAFGFFPILWIVINAIWVYNLTVATGVPKPASASSSAPKQKAMMMAWIRWSGLTFSNDRRSTSKCPVSTVRL